MFLSSQDDIGEELQTDTGRVGTIGRRRFEYGGCKGGMEYIDAVGSDEGGLVGEFSGAEVSEGFEGKEEEIRVLGRGEETEKVREI